MAGQKRIECLALSLSQAPSENVAFLRWQDSGPTIAIQQPDRCAEFLPFLRQILQHELVRIERSVAEDGGKQIRAVPVPRGSRAFLPGWAGRLSFHPGNSVGLLARVVEMPNDIFRDAQPVLVAHLCRDFYEADKAELPNVRCPCGAQYAAGTTGCPSCHGDDPLGVLFEKAGTIIRERWRELAGRRLLQSPVVSSAQHIVGGLRRWLDHFKNRESLSDDLDGPGEVDALLSQLVRFEFLDKGSLESFKSALTNEDSQLRREATSAAAEIRRTWIPGAMDGWIPESATRSHLRKLIADCWGEAIKDLLETSALFAQAAAAFKPVHDYLRREASWFRGFMRGVIAVKTFGISLLIRGIAGNLSEKRREQQFEKFGELLEQSFALAEPTASCLLEAVERHRKIVGNFADRLLRHMNFLLWTDYSRADGKRQILLAKNLQRACGVSSSLWSARRLRDRRLRLRRWKRPHRLPTTTAAELDSWLYSPLWERILVGLLLALLFGMLAVLGWLLVSGML